MTEGTLLKLATWNINSLGVRLPQVLAWLESAQPDVLVLQETKLVDAKFPREELKAAGWHAVFHGQPTYNGVALLSRSEPIDVVKNIPAHGDAAARVIAATVGGVRVIGAYIPNGQAPGSEKFAYKMVWLDTLRAWVAAELAAHPRLVLMGDYNIAPEDCDVHDPVLWEGQIHCTPEERAHFRALLALGLHDAFRLFEQPPKLYSWWDYRMLAFPKNRGLRIDHILVSEALRPRVTACSIDRQPRKNERPSDHAPVIVEIADD
jgi:exodeoxyribonuclease-3